MKKTLFILAILSLALISNAQKDEYAYLKKFWYGYPYIDNKPLKKKVTEAKIKGYTETIKKGNNEYIWIKVNYDEKGNYSSIEMFKKNGNLSKQYSYEYSPSNKNTSQKIMSRNGKKILLYNFKYDKNGMITDEEYTKNGKVKVKINSTYDSLKILESSYYKNGKPELEKKWVYTYYPDKSRKSSIIYNSKGKVLYTWNYECKPEGELASKHKDTTDVCRKETVDNLGNKVITFRKFNEKGKPYKVEYTYNKENQCLGYASYYANDIINVRSKYNKNTGETEEFTIYNKKGIETYRSVNAYNDKDNILETKTYTKGKLHSNSINEFSTSDFVSSMKIFKKGKLEKSCKYDYMFF